MTNFCGLKIKIVSDNLRGSETEPVKPIRTEFMAG